MKVKSYKELVVWQKSVLLVKLVYRITQNFPDEEKFGLVSQIRRCVISIPSNIAEGFGRGSRNNFLNFLRIAQGSLYELETQLIISKELNFINEIQELEALIVEINKMLGSMIYRIRENN